MQELSEDTLKVVVLLMTLKFSYESFNGNKSLITFAWPHAYYMYLPVGKTKYSVQDHVDVQNSILNI